MRIIDVVDHTNVVDDELVFRVPQEGSGDLRFGSQLIVGESQAAIFVRAGQALDAFGPGRHTLSVANLPILSGLIGLATSGRTPFTADVYFVNLKDMPQVGWGTVKPIYIEVKTGLGIMLLRTHGVMELKVSDPMRFLKQYGIGKPVTMLKDIKERMQTILLGELNSILLNSGVDSLISANRVLEDLEGAALVTLNEKFDQLGVQIKAFESNPFDTVNVPVDELRDLVPMEIWLNVLERTKRLDIGMAAAQNPGMGGALAGAGVGLGVGQGLGAALNPNQQNTELQSMQNQMMQQQMMMNQMMQQMMNNNQQAQQPAPAAPAASSPNPQTKEEVQALIDQLDVKLMSGEITEAVYNRLLAKWEDRLKGM
ncbi:MAG: SPFH domain-containing protein [Anaerolineae bacterium]|nr:SPFH domain-containing protein [Chloroflexota bacterium]MBP6298195.1 SPFH domain-containing protein [Anaerolineae bacterium]